MRDHACQKIEHVHQAYHHHVRVARSVILLVARRTALEKALVPDPPVAALAFDANHMEPTAIRTTQCLPQLVRATLSILAAFAYDLKLELLRTICSTVNVVDEVAQLDTSDVILEVALDVLHGAVGCDVAGLKLDVWDLRCGEQHCLPGNLRVGGGAVITYEDLLISTRHGDLEKLVEQWILRDFKFLAFAISGDVAWGRDRQCYYEVSVSAVQDRQAQRTYRRRS